MSPVKPRPTDRDTPSRTTLPPKATWMSPSSTAGTSAASASAPAPSTATPSLRSLVTPHRPFRRPPAGQSADQPGVAHLGAERHQAAAQHGDRQHERQAVGDRLQVPEVLEHLDEDDRERG